MRAVVVIALLGGVVCPPASAAVVSQSGGLVTYQAAAGEINQPIPFIENGRLKVRESNPSTPLSAGAGCAIVSDRLADCGAGSSVRANLGDRDDTYFGTGAGLFPVTVNGEDGNDAFIDGDGAGHRETYVGGAGEDTAEYFLESSPVSLSLDNQANDGEAGEGDFIASDVENLQGGQAADTLTGNSASNDLRGERGNDREQGLGGDDFFEEGASPSGADIMAGGTGVDRVLYRERTSGGHVNVTIDGTANDGASGEADNVLTDVENITGTQFADTLVGSDQANTLAGLGGDDLLLGEGGSDTVFGGDGDDRIGTRDGVRDRVNCNAGFDSASLDLVDDIPADCESVSQGAKDQGPGPVIKRRTLAPGRHARITVSCPRSEKRGCHGRLVVGASLATGHYRLKAGHRVTLHLGLRRRLRPGTHVHVVAHERDNHGRPKLTRQTLKVRKR